MRQCKCTCLTVRAMRRRVVEKNPQIKEKKYNKLHLPSSCQVRAIGKKGFWGASYIIFHISKSYSGTPLGTKVLLIVNRTF